jgi:hypothetical protein
MIPKLEELYTFIVNRSLNKEKTTVKDICLAFPDRYKYNESESNFSNAPTLYEDIDLINETSDLDAYIIIKDNNNFKIGNKDEIEEYMNKLKKHALKQLKKYWVIKRRFDIKNQAMLNNISENNNSVIFEDTNELNKFVNTFLDNELKPIHYSDEFLMKCSITQLHEYSKKLGISPLYGWRKEDYIKEIRYAERNNNK